MQGTASSTGRALLRVAVTSRDGVTVNERFHRAVDFLVFESDGTRAEFVERRLRPATAGRVQREVESLRALLADCAWVVSLGFTGVARRQLEALGFRILEAREAVEPLVRRLALPPP